MLGPIFLSESKSRRNEADANKQKDDNTQASGVLPCDGARLGLTVRHHWLWHTKSTTYGSPWRFLHIGGHLTDTTRSRATPGETMPTSSTYSGAVLDALSRGRGRESCRPFIPDSIDEAEAMSFCLAWGGKCRRHDSLESLVEGARLEEDYN